MLRGCTDIVEGSTEDLKGTFRDCGRILKGRKDWVRNVDGYSMDVQGMWRDTQRTIPKGRAGRRHIEGV